MNVNIQNLVDDIQYYDAVRELRWPEGWTCSKRVIRRGFANDAPCQRCEYNQFDKHFDDLIGTIFSGHHQPLKV
jgi:hypothetical protein